MCVFVLFLPFFSAKGPCAHIFVFTMELDTSLLLLVAAPIFLGVGPSMQPIGEASLRAEGLVPTDTTDCGPNL